MQIFERGKLTICLDGGAGSSAKGLRGAQLWRHHREPHTVLATNTFMENAAHTVTDEHGNSYIYQCLSSVTGLRGLECQYLGPGCVFATETLLNEIATHQLSPEEVRVHPNIAIVTAKDIDYERGTANFDGDQKAECDSINLKIGSTLHGVGAARARRVLRRPDAVIAKQVPELEPYLCRTQDEILVKLSNGYSGLGEIAQGYQLSLYSQFYPRCTSRNCSVSAFLDDSLLPPSVVGPVVVNFRTYPIRVNNNKYLRKSDNKVLTWDEMCGTPESEVTVVRGDSGNCYPDQREITWDEISKRAGKEICEMTSLTRLPRRVFEFSKINLIESLVHNNANTPMYISVNFMNYVDPTVEGKRTANEVLTPTVVKWLKDNVLCDELVRLVNGGIIKLAGMFIGTWKTIDDSISLDTAELLSI